MIKGANRLGEISKYSIIVCILILIFSVMNVFNSALFGQYSANRTYVYYSIGAIMIAELVYLALSSLRYFRVNWFTIIITSLFAYIFALDYLKGINTWTMLVHCGTLALWLCTFKFVDKTCSKRGETIKLYRLLINGLFYLFAVLSIIAQRDIADIRGQNVAVVNLSYYCLACFPITLLDSDKKHSVFNVAVAIATSIYSLKRGAIVTVVFMLLTYYYVDGKINKKTISTWAKVIMAGVIIIIALLVVDYYSGGILSARFTRTSLLDGSGRSRNIASAITRFNQRNFGERLFGTGSGTSTLTIGITLHNDFLEFLYCFGYVGLVFYLSFIIALLRRLKLFMKSMESYSSVFAMIIAFTMGLCLFEGALLNFAFLYAIIQISVIERLYIIGKQNNGVLNDS